MKNTVRQDYNNNQSEKQDKINRISNENPFYETVPGGYRESYLIIRCQPHLSSAEKLLYDELVYYYTQSGQNDRDTAYPSQSALARKLGVSVSAVSQILKKLEKNELILICDRKDAPGRSKEYILLEYPLEIWNNYFRLLETELEKAKTSKKKAQKEKAIETAAKKLQKQSNFRELNFRILNIKNTKVQTLEYLSSTLEYLSSNSKKSLSEDGDNKGSGDHDAAPINQSNLSEYNNQSIRSDKSDDSEESTVISGTEIDDKSSKRSDISNSNDQSSSHCDKEREQSRTDDDRTDKSKQTKLNQNSSPADAENEKFRETIDKFRETKDDWRTSTGHLVTLLKLIGIDDGFGFAGGLRKKFSDAVVIEGVKRFKQQQAVGNQKSGDNPEGYLTTVLSNISPSKKSSKKEKKSTNDLPDNLSLWSWEKINAYGKKLERSSGEEYAEFWDRVKREKLGQEE